MPEVAIVHICPHCGRTFDSPSFCVKGQVETEPRPMTVTKQQARDLFGRTEDEAPQ